MGRRVTIEAECVVSQLDYPRYLDHAWLSIASNIHLRLFELTPEDSYVPGAVLHVERSHARKCYLKLNNSRTWSDGAPLRAREVARALERGRAYGLIHRVSVDGENGVALETSDGVPVSEALLGSALFSLTPSCRDASALSDTATCGPFAVSATSLDRRIMKFRRREDGGSTVDGPEEVAVVVTSSREQGLRLLASGQLDLTCPLGAEPLSFQTLSATSTAVNRATNLFMVLRAYPGSEFQRRPELMRELSSLIDRIQLSRVTGGTLVPLDDVRSITMRGNKFAFAGCSAKVCSGNSAIKVQAPSSFELRYANYEPNRQVAESLRAQLEPLLPGRIALTEVSYHDYTHEIFERREGLSLEIVQSPVSDAYIQNLWNFFSSESVKSDSDLLSHALSEENRRPQAIPLLQNLTTLLASDQSYKNRKIVTREAIIPWSRL